MIRTLKFGTMNIIETKVLFWGLTMDVQLRQQIFDKAKKWILEAGELIRKELNKPLIVDTKTNRNDLVTQLDKEVEFFFTTKIKQNYPKHSILSEEGFGEIGRASCREKRKDRWRKIVVKKKE